MKNNLDKIVMYLFLAFLIEMILGIGFIILITNGIRVNRKANVSKDGLELVQYEQVYHVFMSQEIFLSIENKSDKMISTVTIKEKTSGKTDTLHKIKPGQSIKMYFSLDSYFKNAEFDIIELEFVEIY